VARLRAIAAQLRDAAAEFEADRWSGADCAVIAEELAATVKACAAAGARAAARAVDCNAGDVEWLARTTGSTPSDARTTLSTITAAAACPATNDALATGAVSLGQAREIVRAEAAVPGSEVALLEVATTTGMAGLREEARRVVLRARDRDELHREQHASRAVRHWVDELGMVAGNFRLPPESGVPFVNRLDAETDRLRRAARKNGNAEARDAHAADAFVKMTSGTGKGQTSRADVVFVCSLDAYRRGTTEGDELCHVIGAGPVPVSVVREAVANDAFVKAVVTDGVKIELVKHFGRRMPVELRTALELGPPTTLDGAVCANDGCDRRHELEMDHDDPVANGGMTSYENIKLRCKPDHWAKTERDRKAGILDGKEDERGPP